jgi:hypothetical protein
MSAPEIATVNAVRWRLQIVDRRLREARELLRAAAAAPDYLGPPIAAIEQLEAGLTELRGQMRNWIIDEQIRRAAALPRNTRRVPIRNASGLEGDRLRAHKPSRKKLIEHRAVEGQLDRIGVRRELVDQSLPDYEI